MDIERKDLIIAKTIGEPIDVNFRVPVALSAIADLDTVEAGEKLFNLAQYDEDVDEVLDIEADGRVNVVKVDPKTDTILTFKGLNSRMKYVLLDTILSGAAGQGNPDLAVLGRKKEAITRAMDKLELYRILKAIIDAAAVEEISYDTGEDLYDVIMKAKHAVEDYGDNYVLLCGSAVKEAIDLYSKKKVASHYYDVSLVDLLAKLKVEVIKVIGQVRTGTIASSATVRLLDTNKFILVARNSTLTAGKPIHFVRRKIPANIAAQMGGKVDELERGLFVTSFPINIGGTNPNVLGYGVYGFESIVEVIKNPKAIKKSVDLSAIL